ncbi:MAG: leucine-rich repeat domain-containing protein [Verrucomicrobiota bacterium]
MESDHINFINILFGAASSVLATLLCYLVARAKKMMVQRKSRDLHPYFTEEEVIRAAQFYVPTKCQNIDPAECDEISQSSAFTVRDKLIPKLIRTSFKESSDDSRFFLILAGSGMGKTTFLINLYLTYSKMWKNDFLILLLPLGAPAVDEELSKIKSEKRRRTILLLDGFDEDPKAALDSKLRIKEIVEKTWEFRKVLVTCRTQFFPDRDDEPAETNIRKYGVDSGFHQFRKIYISPFDIKDVDRYLFKRFGFLSFKKRLKAREILRKCPHLMVRPMLLDRIEDIMASSYEFSTLFQIYQFLVDRWIIRESEKYIPTRREHFKLQLETFTREVALDIFRNWKKRESLSLAADEASELAKKQGIELDRIELTSKSLLNRKSNGHYKFAHKSILEFVIARELIRDPRIASNDELKGFDQIRFFVQEMAGSKWEEIIYEVIENQRRAADQKNETRPKSIRIKTPNELREVEDLTISNVPRIESHKLKLLANMTQLRVLRLENNHLSDISFIGELVNLEMLYLSDNLISDANPIRNLKKLVALDLIGNQITDMSFLLELPEIEHLQVTLWDSKCKDSSTIRARRIYDRKVEVRDFFFRQDSDGKWNQIEDRSLMYK